MMKNKIYIRETTEEELQNKTVFVIRVMSSSSYLLYYV